MEIHDRKIEEKGEQIGLSQNTDNKNDDNTINKIKDTKKKSTLALYMF